MAFCGPSGSVRASLPAAPGGIPRLCGLLGLVGSLVLRPFSGLCVWLADCVRSAFSPALLGVAVFARLVRLACLTLTVCHGSGGEEMMNRRLVSVLLAVSEFVGGCAMKEPPTFLRSGAASAMLLWAPAGAEASLPRGLPWLPRGCCSGGPRCLCVAAWPVACAIWEGLARPLGRSWPPSLLGAFPESVADPSASETLRSPPDLARVGLPVR